MVPGMLGEEGATAQGVLHGPQAVQRQTHPNLCPGRTGGGASVQVRLFVLDSVRDLCGGVPYICSHAQMVLIVLNYYLCVDQ